MCKMKGQAHASDHTAQSLNSIYATGTQKTWEGIRTHEKKGEISPTFPSYS